MEAMMYKCPACDSALDLTKIQNGKPVIRCDFCGQTSALPKFLSKENLAAYNNAHEYRKKGQFEKAQKQFESIQEDFSDDPELWWSILMCKYGVTYVEDPMTHERKPTIQRMQMELVTDTVEYQNAIRYADEESKEESKRSYEERGSELLRIQEKYIDIVKKEKPYDIFICFKKTNEQNGGVTDDCAMAHDIYDLLEEEGYRVFFSEITLQSKLGVEFEPYIYAALESARYMLVMCTDVNYLNAPWVKSEWKRYLNLMKEDNNKNLTVVSKFINDNDLPGELRMLQGLHWADMDAKAKLKRALRDALGNKKSNETIQSGTKENMLANVKNELMTGRYEDAARHAGKIMEIYDAECWEAYLYRHMANCHCRELGALRYCSPDYENIMDMRMVFDLCSDAKILEQLKADKVYIQRRLYDESIISEANRLAVTGRISKLKQAIAMLEGGREGAVKTVELEQEIVACREELQRKKRSRMIHLIIYLLAACCIVGICIEKVAFGVDEAVLANEEIFDRAVGMPVGIALALTPFLTAVGVFVCIKLGAKDRILMLLAMCAIIGVIAIHVTIIVCASRNGFTYRDAFIYGLNQFSAE